jgi:small-conductance mechanosensitive channel
MPAEPAAGPNTAGLTAAARTRHELTRVKAVKALHDLQRQGVPVTFGVVAATAGVSRSWLYRQADLRQQIDQLRQTEPASASHAAEGATQSSGASLRARLNQALERNRQLADDNARLRSQLAQALGEQRQPPPQVARQRYSRHASTTIGPC